jgi:type II secretory ATPase GspE/PulE/Tfp pilus assembly ATPase PilB-like protein
MEAKILPDSVSELQQKIARAEEVKRISNQIHAAKDLDQILLDMNRDILGLFDAEELTLYAVDPEKKEVYAKLPYLEAIEEMRLPIDEQSIAGFTAKYLRPVNIQDAYTKADLTRIHPALCHDSSWDKKTGFRTKQVLTYPIVAENKYLMGVVQLLNKKGEGRFTKKDEESVAEIAKSLGIAFFNLRKLAKKTVTKFDYLVASNKITQSELDAAIHEARKGVSDMESLLIEKYKVSKADIGKSLSQFYQCPHVEFDDRTFIDPELLKNLNIDYIKKSCWIPLKRNKNVIEILIDDPNALERVQDIQRMFPGQTIRFSVGLRRDIAQFFRVATGQVDPGITGDAGSITDILGELVNEAQIEQQEDSSAIGVDENDNVIVRLANKVIADAYRLGVSDIHIEPYGDKRETVVRFRVDGSCSEYMKIPASYRRAIVSRLKIMASLDISERRKPQDGKIKFKVSGGREIELRVATVPTAGYNEDVVMRILAASEPLSLDKMGFSDRNLEELKKIAEKPYGIILCVGPTGSGKTTTHHAALGHINTPERKILTAEDPVEITQYGLRQVQVHPKIGFTFAIAMRAFLRADPDVIMVGEMRDKETAETGIEASLTGHLVFSTLHTNSAVETITRLLDMGCDSFSFADAMLGVMAQRLCKRICKECSEEYRPTEEEYNDLAHGYGMDRWDKLGVKFDAGFKLRRGKGCDTCNRTGFRGRLALHELLIGTDRMKRLIQNHAKTEEMLNAAIEEGMTTLVQDGIQKVLQGLTTFKQIKAVAIK